MHTPTRPPPPQSPKHESFQTELCESSHENDIYGSDASCISPVCPADGGPAEAREQDFARLHGAVPRESVPERRER